jgi:hypothetical protein
LTATAERTYPKKIRRERIKRLKLCANELLILSNKVQKPL